MSITGNDNQVELETSEATTLTGNDNHVEATESVGTVSTSGSGNGVNPPNVAIG